jgi:hypothetical protein
MNVARAGRPMPRLLGWATLVAAVLATLSGSGSAPTGQTASTSPVTIDPALVGQIGEDEDD